MAVSSVEWRLDGVRIGAIQYVSPYSITLNTAAIPNGEHIISAYVLDTAGNSATDSRTITVSNTVASTDPVVPSDSTTEVVVTPLKWVITNTLFTNTLEEHSLASIEAELMTNAGETNFTEGDDGFLNVLDYGAVGDGVTDDTTAIQNTINRADELGKGVLIPLGGVFAVKFNLLDSWVNGYWMQSGYVFKIPSGMYIKLDGTIKPNGSTVELGEYASSWVIFENENNFRFVSGSTTTEFPAEYTGDKQNLYESSGCHTNGVASNTLQIIGDVDLSSIEVGVPFTCPPVDNLLPLMVPRNIGIRVSGVSPFQSVITSADNVAKTITVADSFNISAGSPRAFTVENNLYDEDIKIVGRGTVDLSGLHNYDSSSFWGGVAVMLCRFYRVKDLVIDGITVIGFVIDGFEIGFSQNVTFSNVTMKYSFDGNNAFTSCGNFDVCGNLLIENCNFHDNPVGVAIFLWACRDVKIINCSGTDMPYIGSGVGGLVHFEPISMEFNSDTTLPTNYVSSIQNGTEEIWGMHEFTPALISSLTEFGDMISWNILIDGCTSRRNGFGLSLLVETYYGGFGAGITVVNSDICSNKIDGIAFGSAYQPIITNNNVKNNGWGSNTNAPYYPEKFNYNIGNANKPFYD